MKMLLVPQEDIDKIEKARKDLWHIIREVKAGHIKPSNDFNLYFWNISEPMWKLSHKKYKQTFLNKLKNKFAKP